MFLGVNGFTALLIADGLGFKVLESGKANFMVRNVSKDEIMKAMFSIGENKSPGPDGFTSAFFKSSWEVVGEEVCNAILDFFCYG